MRSYTDEQLVAYAANELSAEQTAELAAALKEDTALARRYESLIAAGDASRENGASSPSGAVPQYLRGALDAAAPARSWMALAVTAVLALAAGLTAGMWLSSQRGSATAESLVSGLVINRADLQAALEQKAGGEALIGSAGGSRYQVTPTASIRTADGRYCREFELSAEGRGPALAVGVACRQREQWAVQAILRVTAAMLEPSDTFAPAPRGIDMSAVLGAGRALSASEEKERLERSWKD